MDEIVKNLFLNSITTPQLLAIVVQDVSSEVCQRICQDLSKIAQLSRIGDENCLEPWRDCFVNGQIPVFQYYLRQEHLECKERDESFTKKPTQ